MKNAGPVGALLTAASAAIIVAGCGGSGAPSLAAGAQAASAARGPVAAKYWQVIAALNGQLEQNLAPGRGTFGGCQDSSARARYHIQVDLAARDARLPAGEFLTTVAQTLIARGWSKFDADNSSTMISTEGDDRLTLTPGTGSQSGLITLVLTGPCVNVGPAFVSALPLVNGSMADYYPFAQVSAAPTPTAPVPTP